MIVNNSRSILRQSTTWIHQSNDANNGTSSPMDENDQKYELLRRIANAIWLFSRTMQTHLLQPTEDAAAYQADVRERFQNNHREMEFVEMMIAAQHKPTLALYELSCAINALPLDTFQRTTIDAEVTSLCDALGACDRIFSSPVPVIYTRFAGRFVELFMLFVPLALYEVSERWLLI